jgi:tetraacyldisaccharide 4'-kinase
VAEVKRSLVRIWTGSGKTSRTVRIALSPFSALYGAVSAVRGFLYDRHVLPIYQSSVPIISVGNLTVGGTGKTPIAAWIASEIIDRGRVPAIVLRGYGEDEPLVHKRLNGNVEVVVCRDRVRGIREAIACGADVVVLDDGFQHRRAARVLDILLISADGWRGDATLLPAGPWREPLRAARRASLLIITCKTAGPAKLEALQRALASAAPSVQQSVARLRLGELFSTTTGQAMPLAVLRDATVLAIAAIANPESFFEQLSTAGAKLIPRAFPDHHNFSQKEVRELASDGEAADFVVCTLKDAVKLEPIWPPQSGSLWYVSQRVSIDEGRSRVDELLTRAITEQT